MQGIYLMIPILLIVLVLFLYFVPLGLWIQSGVSIGWGKIGIIKLVIMRIRKIPPKLVANGIINLHRAGLDFVTSEELETHFLAGGNIALRLAAFLFGDRGLFHLGSLTAFSNALLAPRQHFGFNPDHGFRAKGDLGGEGACGDAAVDLCAGKTGDRFNVPALDEAASWSSGRASHRLRLLGRFR